MSPFLIKYSIYKWFLSMPLYKQLLFNKLLLQKKLKEKKCVISSVSEKSTETNGIPHFVRNDRKRLDIPFFKKMEYLKWTEKKSSFRAKARNLLKVQAIAGHTSTSLSNQACNDIYFNRFLTAVRNDRELAAERDLEILFFGVLFNIFNLKCLVQI